MNLFVCILALALVSATISVPVNKTHSFTKRGVGYGGYGNAPIIQETPQPAAAYMEQVVVPPPIPPPAPIMTDAAPALPSFSYAAAPQRSVVRDDVVNGVFNNEVHELEPEYQKLCLNKKSVDDVFYLPHPTQQSWYIQCDAHGSSFLKKCPAGTIFTANQVCENINDLHVVEKTVVKPQLESSRTVVGSYNQVPSFGADAPISVETTNIEIVHEAPEFAELCLSKRGSGVVSFYMQHPTQQAWYIQCDESGRAFLKECPAGTIFTLNKVCEKIGELHAVEVIPTQMDRVITPTSYSSGLSVSSSSYGSSAATTGSATSSYGTLSASAPVNMDTVTTFIDNTIVKDAPEFRELCMSKRTAGVAVFYLQHPNKQSWYIQCDESGRAFVKECPAGTIFTLNLACENVNDLHAIEKTVVAAPQLDSTVGSYNVAPMFTSENANAAAVVQTTVITESPEFRELCLSKRTAGVAAFYLPHPNKQSWYIQCDEFSRAFVKECPAGTVFTVLNLACEKIGELQTISPIQLEAVPSVQTISYGSSAPSLNFEASAPVVETARVEVIQESPEFKSMCQSSSQFGITTFYLPHPTKQSWYIQCDQFGHAFLKECPATTIFTSRLTCEKIGELQEVVETVMMSSRPAEREQTIQQPIFSYAEQRPVETVPIVQTIAVQPTIVREQQSYATVQQTSRPIVREQSYSTVQTSPIVQSRPIVQQQQVISPVTILREQPSTSYGTRQVVREQASSSYGAVATPVVRTVNREMIRGY